MRDQRTFLMITTMFPTLTHQAYPPTMKIPKDDQKNRTGCNCKVRELEKMGRTSKTRLHKMSTDRTLNHQENASKACLLLALLVVMHHSIPFTYWMVDRKWTTKHKSLMTSSKILGLSLTAPGNTMASKERPMMTMMRLLSIKLPSSTTSALFKVLMIEVLHIALCFQAGLMGLTWKEMHLFRAWKTLTCSIQLLSAYKRLPPIRCLHPNHGNCSNHYRMCLGDQYVSSLPCIQRSLFQILPHLLEPPVLCQVMMNSSKLAYNLSRGNMPHWHQKWPCRKAMSLLKRSILLLLNKAAPPVTCNQCIKPSLQGIHPCLPYKWFPPSFHPVPPRDQSLKMLLKSAWVLLPPLLPT
jgi:hypothetical protein